MPRVSWKAYDREVAAIENDDCLSNAEKMEQVRELDRDIRETFRDAQEQERRDTFGDW